MLQPQVPEPPFGRASYPNLSLSPSANRSPSVSLLRTGRFVRHSFPGPSPPSTDAPPSQTLASWLGSNLTSVGVPELELSTTGLSAGSNEGPRVVAVFRGLRVRMGMHTGLLAAREMQMSRSFGRVCYSGEACGRGGLLLPATAFGPLNCSGESRWRVTATASARRSYSGES